VSAITLEIEAAHLRAISAFTSVDKTRYVLQGVLLEQVKREIRLVATDGRRLVAVRPRACYCGSVDDLAVIVPAWLIDAIPQTARLVKLSYEPGARIEIAISDLIISAPPIDANFPNWRQVVPNDDSLLCDTRELSARLEDFAVFSAMLKAMGEETKARVRTSGPAGVIMVHAVTGAGEVIGLTMNLNLTTSPSLAWARDGKAVAS